jgi:hypothetical protein
VTPFVDEARAVLADAGLRVVEALRVTDGRYFSYVCQNLRCCPPQGVAFDTATSAVSAGAVLAGRPVLPSRSAVVDSLAPLTGAAEPAMAELADVAAQRVVDLIEGEGIDAATAAGSKVVYAAVGRYQAAGTLDDEEMAELVAYLAIPAVRDVGWRATTDESWAENLWRDATRRAYPALAAPPASLLALTAWRRGNGVLANVALRRALQADPDYKLALLVNAALAAGLPPSAVADL